MRREAQTFGGSFENPIGGIAQTLNDQIAADGGENVKQARPGFAASDSKAAGQGHVLEFRSLLFQGRSHVALDDLRIKRLSRFQCIRYGQHQRSLCFGHEDFVDRSQWNREQELHRCRQIA